VERATPAADADQEGATPDDGQGKPADDATKQAAGRDEASDIIVTGTRIVRSNMTSNAPIATVDRAYLRERGLARIEDALSQIPQIAPILGLQGNGITQRTRVDLRKLGAGRTLTLLNGQRIDNDVNIIPGALVERIDILTGGASAVYGSDAIAGVVNYILKRGFNGVVLDAEVNAFQHRNDNETMLGIAREAGYRLPPHNYFGRSDEYLSLAAGKDLFDARLNVSGFVNWSKTRPIRLSSIDTVACPLIMNPLDADVIRNDQWACNAKDYSPYGEFSIGDEEYALSRDGSRSWRPFDRKDMQRVPDEGYLQRADKRLSAGGFVTADLPASIKLDVNFLYTRFREYSQQDQGIYPYFAFDAPINCDNPFLSGQQAQILCGAAAGSPVLSDPISVEIWRPDVVQRFEPSLRDWRASVKLSGPVVGRIRFEASYQRSQNLFRNALENFNDYSSGALLPHGLQVRNVNGVPTCLSVIDGTDPQCLPVDLFSTASKLDDKVWKWLTNNGVFHERNDSAIINGVVSGTLEDYGIRSPWAKNGIGFALIGEQRRIHIDSGGTGGLRNWHRFSAGARVREIGGELDVPLVEDKPLIRALSINGGYRLSRYTTYDRLVPTWKVEGSYAPVAGVRLRLRGSINRAVRVAMLERLEAETYGRETVLDLCAPPRPPRDGESNPRERYSFEQCSFGGMTQAQYDALTDYHGCDSNGYCPGRLVYGGNPNLQPEHGRSYTLGLVLQPSAVPGFTGSVDLYDIHVDKGFESARYKMAFDGCYTQKVQFWCSFYRRDPKTGVLKDIDARWTNGGNVHSQGIDFSVAYALDPKRFGVDAEIGTFNVDLNGTLTTKADLQIAPGSPMRACAGLFGFLCADPSPEWRHVVSLRWRMPHDRGGLGLAWRYTAGTTLSKLSDRPGLRAEPGETPFPLVSHIPAYSYFDASSQLAVTKFLDLRLNAQNLFDKDPPMIGGGLWMGFWNTDPTYYTIRGRTLRAGLTAHL
jgi:outer membrane receptor protein involved in Fe transport